MENSSLVDSPSRTLPRSCSSGSVVRTASRPVWLNHAHRPRPGISNAGTRRCVANCSTLPGRFPALFRPAPLEPVPAAAALQGPLTAMVTDVVVPPWKPMVLPAPAAGSAGSDIRAVEWETTLTGRARLLLPGDQQLKFTAALAHRQVTVWASDRSIHVVLDGAVIRTRPSRLSEHDLRNLVLRGLGRADGFRARRRLRADSVRGPESLRRSRSRRTDRRGWTAVSAVRG
jgi:hypothetical protein